VAGNDSGIGNADLKDVAAMRSAINAAFAKDRKRVVYHDLARVNKKTGKPYSSDEILAHLKSMKVGQNDNILVFHSGHGCITDKNRPEETHILFVDGGSFARKDIRSILWDKQPRALMILTDCCSSFTKAAAVKITLDEEEEQELVEVAFVDQSRASKGPSLNAATIRNLLLKPVGLVNITAAQDGVMAIAGFKGENPGQAGSAFTVALMRLWYSRNATFTSWEQMFPKLRNETNRASGGQHHARAFQIATRRAASVVTTSTGQSSPRITAQEVQRSK